MLTRAHRYLVAVSLALFSVAATAGTLSAHGSEPHPESASGALQHLGIAEVLLLAGVVGALSLASWRMARAASRDERQP